MFVRYRYREPNGLIKLEAAARPGGSLYWRPADAYFPLSLSPSSSPSSISFSLSLDSTPPCHELAARPASCLSAAAPAADGMCACKSPISFAHFLHFKIRSAKEGERE